MLASSSSAMLTTASSNAAETTADSAAESRASRQRASWTSSEIPLTRSMSASMASTSQWPARALARPAPKRPRPMMQTFFRPFLVIRSSPSPPAA